MASTSQPSMNTQESYPFKSAHFDPVQISGTHVQHLLRKHIRFATASSLWCISIEGFKTSQNYLNGDSSLATALDNLELTRESKERRVDVFFGWLRNSANISLSLPMFLRLAEDTAIPPQFIEVLSSNNGCYASSQVIDESSDIYFKMPWGPYFNGTAYFGYHIYTRRAIALSLFDRTMHDDFIEIYSKGGSSATDPLAVLSLLIIESRKHLEGERRKVDDIVVKRESETGTTFINVRDQIVAPIEAYASLYNRVQDTNQHVMYFERTVEFQVGLVHFLIQQHDALTKIRFDASADSSERIRVKVGAQRVTDSLNMSATLIEQMLEQVRTLAARIKIQIALVEGRFNQYNSENTVSIARETRRDSVSMKTIAALTMVFLPGTFTSALFSMTFFNADPVEAGGDLRVSSSWWIYAAVTIPLTIAVLMCWILWIRYRGDGLGITQSGFLRHNVMWLKGKVTRNHKRS
ncbi:hypothetical protein BDY21DRAFT_96191 [Lineolata rhizophorae]|uniref:Cora-like Mg2+ transporter protein-domain-containing protein n=1 Tax=Lineolata rhizophorae TaxID=578093 RepID=A0A6A6NT14_9PEZI|nr:hypothetical protein BDY21DRAFT_96191 [Lineolata rhizophorae]